MLKRWLGGCAFAGIASVAACNETADPGTVHPPGGSGPTGSVATAQEACAAMAEKGCQRLWNCSSWAVSLTYGDLDACKARTAASCEPFFGLDGVAITPDSLVA